MDTWQDLIKAWGGPVPFAKSLGLSRKAGYAMWARNFVSTRHWPVVVAKAPHKGLQGITFELLMTLKGGPELSVGRFPRTPQKLFEELVGESA